MLNSPSRILNNKICVRLETHSEDLTMTLDKFFFPKSIVMIGASRKPGKFGNTYLFSLLQFKYPEKGKIYPINASGEEILGLQSVPTLEAVPEPIDLAYITVPAKSVISELEKCIQKNINSIIIVTAGFKEMDEKGHELECRIKELVKETNCRIMGPNCFGVYCPKGGITLLPGAEFPQDAGPVSFIGQSGGNAVYFVTKGVTKGLRFNKVVSYGNASDLSISDFLEYLNEDEETTIIGGYLEGITESDKTRLRGILPKLRKPLIIWKAGHTQDGCRAAQSHTGFLASSQEIWQGLFKQYNIIGVDSLEELVDTTVVMHHVSNLKGRNMAVIGGGGAIGVEMVDQCNINQLRVPQLSKQAIIKINQFLAGGGVGTRNPIDLGDPMYLRLDGLSNILNIVAAEENIHGIIIDQIANYISLNSFRECVKIFKEVKEKHHIPIFVVLRQTSKLKKEIRIEKLVRTVQEWYNEEKIPTFELIDFCAKAINNCITYSERKR